MFNQDIDAFNRYTGLLMYSLDNCKNAFEDLESFNKELNERFYSNDFKSDIKDFNKLGRINRVLKDYLILKIRTLFDKDPRTLSLLQLEEFLIKSKPEVGEQFKKELSDIRERYAGTLEQIKRIADKVVAHADNEEVELLHTADLLNNPIPSLVRELELLIVATGHKFHFT